MSVLVTVVISFLLGCVPAEMTPVVQPDDVTVRAEMQRRQVDVGDAGLMVVTVDTTEGWSAELTPPQVDGLAIEAVPMQVTQAFGRRTATFEFHITGEGGSYVIPSFEVVVAGDGEPIVTETPVMFFDVGEPGFSSELSGFAAPPEKPESPWLKRLLLAAVALVTLAVIWVFFKRLSKRASIPVPLPPEDEEALGAWSAICEDGALSDHERALALSRIFRRYMERRFSFGASAMTTSEILAQCSETDVSGDISDVDRLLSATDLIKFAGRRGGTQLFVDLGSELVGFVQSNGNLASVQTSELQMEAGDV
jgi:hypothetical protein